MTETKVEELMDADVLAMIEKIAPFPWRVEPVVECGLIYDANDRAIITVDQHGDMPDQDVFTITAVVVAAVRVWVLQVRDAKKADPRLQVGV